MSFPQSWLKFGNFVNFSGKYHKNSGILIFFSDKNHVKFGRFADFNTYFVRAKIVCPLKLTEPTKRRQTSKRRQKNIKKFKIWRHSEIGYLDLTLMRRLSANYPVSDKSETGYCLRPICLYASFFVSLLTRLRENGWTDLHEIFKEGAEWPWDDLIQFWVNSEKPRDAAMRNTGTGFVVLSHHSLLNYMPIISHF